MNTGLWQSINSMITQGKLEDAIRYLESGLESCISPRFKALIGADFSNDPSLIAGELSRFIHACNKCFPTKAVYLEMNGFDINPDRWYFDFFGYKKYIDDSESLDWLAEWDSGRWKDIALTGLEKVQNDFAWYSGDQTEGYKDDNAKIAAEYAILLVMCKFANLIEKAVKTGLIEERVRILATAHDFDIVTRFTT